MDPGMIMAMLGALSAGAGALTGSKGEQGSTYNEGQLSQIDQMLADLKSMKGGGGQDITQNQGYQQGQEWLNSLFNDPEFFKSFEAPLQRQFEEQTVPELANRFAGMGSGGSTGSTAFRNQLGREGSNLSTNIAALRGGMQQQGVNQQLQYSQQPVQNYLQMLQQAMQPTQNTYTPANAGVGQLAAPFLSAAGSYWGAGGGGNLPTSTQPQSGGNWYNFQG
jgi:hypothetical protein